MMTRFYRFVPLVCIVCLFGVQTAFCAKFRLPKTGNDIIGKVHVAHSRSGDTLWAVGRRYDVGIDEMIRANPGINPKRGMRRGRRLVIPSQYILPPGPRVGIVINLAELRLYYYPQGRNVVITEPVGIGKEGWATPLGETTIIAKTKDPYWRPTENVRADAARNGTPIPKVFPPGPDNPLGRHMMRLAWPTYLIHGTNRPDGVGGRVSAGCIRMYPEGIKQLFEQVPVGTKVRVLSSPYKVGWHHNRLYLEAHEPLTEELHLYRDGLAPMVSQVYAKTKDRHVNVSWRVAKKVARHHTGIPHTIGARH